MSVPRLMPPSMKMGIKLPMAFLMAGSMSRACDASAYQRVLQTTPITAGSDNEAIPQCTNVRADCSQGRTAGQD